MPLIRFAWSVHQRMEKRWGYCSLGKSGNLRDLLICPIAGATATSLIEESPAWEETQAHPGRRTASRHLRPLEAPFRATDRLKPEPQRRRPDEHSALYRGRHPPKAPEHQVDQGPGQSVPASQGGVSLVLAGRYLQGRAGERPALHERREAGSPAGDEGQDIVQTLSRRGAISWH